MIPHITTGSDMKGLLRYLVGPGKANEHTNPHLVGGDPFLQAWHGNGQELDVAAAHAMATYVDRPRELYGTEVKTRVKKQNPQNGSLQLAEWKDVSVWHCSLSLPPGESLTDDQWKSVTQDFADGMGLSDASGKAAVRWVAVHHGPSAGGNDHVHIAASTVREDGTRWEGRFRDWPTSQKVCRELEVKYNLTRVDGAERGTATLGARPAETAAAKRAGAPTIQREEVAQRVRAAAVASTSEAEWIRRVRHDGVVLKPRFANGTTDVVAGYRAALKGQGKLNFYGGGQLGADLSLPRLRELWPQASLEQADQAAVEWQAAHHGKAPVGKGRETAQVNAAAAEKARQNLQRFTEQLGQVPVSDRATWGRAAREVSGALSAAAMADPTNAPQLRAAATALARTAQDRRPGGAAGQRRPESAAGAALVLLASRGDKPGVATAALMAQILRAAAAVRDYHREVANLREARAVHTQLVPLAPLAKAAAPAAAPTINRQPAGLPVTPERGDRDGGR